MGAIKQWMQTLDDASLQRVADATKWRRWSAGQDQPFGDYSSTAPGCLLCHASGNRYGSFCTIVLGPGPDASALAERRYMDYAARHDEDRAGRLMNAFARSVLASRAIAAMPKSTRAAKAEGR